MNLLIISCTPRIKSKSNTDKIIKEFSKGYEEKGNKTEVLYLSQRNEWVTIRKNFYENDNILFAIPLYIECIPGIMLEFLESLEAKKDNKTKIGFLLQGGFDEASQLRCCEEYLEKLPNMLGCIYNGTLLKGGCFPISMMDENTSQKMIEPFYEMGKYYAGRNYFEKKTVSKFAKPEYYSKKRILVYNLLTPVNKMIFQVLAKKLGCKKSINDKPYNKYIVK